MVRLRRKCNCTSLIISMSYTYILYSSSTNKFYIGSSRRDSQTRLEEHNQGKTKSTKAGVPWQFVWEEEHLHYSEARKREIFLKSGVGRNWIKEKFGYLKIQKV